MNPPAQKARLGKGLGALLGDYVDVAEPRDEAQRLKVSAIRPNPKQPRRAFSPSELEELAQSIDQNGLLQPLLVRPAPGLAVVSAAVTGIANYDTGPLPSSSGRARRDGIPV